MALIQIFANGIALDFVKETLSIKKENNALITDFKVSHSSVPFLIIENATTIQALGSRDLTSINKKRIIPVDVIELGEKYYGELQVLSYVNGYRKCNLKYATQLLTLMNTKIGDFMPVVSVIPGETNPAPYIKEETFTKQSGFYTPSEWRNYPVNFIGKSFPEVKWQFPTMKWSNKFGEALTQDDHWIDYTNYINLFNDDLTVFIENEYVDTTVEIISVSNKNVVSPQVYLLSPLFYALETKGFTLAGGFTQSEFIRRLLFFSNENNLTKTTLSVLLKTYSFSGAWEYSSLAKSYFKSESYTIPTPGKYTIEYSFTFSGPATSISGVPLFRLYFVKPGGTTGPEIFTVRTISTTTFEVNGKEEIELNSGNSVLYYFSKDSIMPVSFSVKIKNNFKKEYEKLHPTIELSRYLPDWTFADYLNQLKNTFNLNVSINDFKKEFFLDFVEDFIVNEEKVIVNKSLEIESYEQIPYEAFVLSYANEKDTALYITSTGPEIKTTQFSDFDFSLKNKFKLISRNSITAELSDELADKEGTGLMIYDPANKPFISESFNGKNLKIEGAGGIHETFWLKTLKFRLNASVLELSGPFSEIELKKIANVNKIYIDNQGYIVSSLEYSETNQENFILNLRLESINY